MACVRSCANCKNRATFGWGEWVNCLTYEMAAGEEEERKAASHYGMYEFGSPYERETPSATCGDYGPSNPWNAPGMSVRDFI